MTDAAPGGGRRRTIRKIIVAVLAIASFAAAPAYGQDYCESLRRQLSQIPEQPGEEQFQRNLRDLTQARTDYNQLYSRARSLNCFAIFQRFADAQCPSVRGALNQLERRIGELERLTRSVSPALAARGNLVSQLRQYGCPVVSTFRTLCVRPSDGYFYPLAYAVTADVFGQHELVCQAQCEGARLFVHRNPGEDIADAVGLNGERYVDLPNAFAYQEAYDPTAVCRSSTDLFPWLVDQFADIGSAPEPIATEIGTVGFSPLPVPRPMVSEDPETIANRLGGFVPGQPVDAAATEQALLRNDAGMRLIGPAFLYAQ